LSTKFPPLPDGYFFRVDDLLGAPVLRIQKNGFLGSKTAELVWIDEEDQNPEGLVRVGEYLKSRLLEKLETSDFIEKFAGDYPPKEL